MAKRSLGPNWRGRTPEERDRFVALFRELLENSYLGKIEAYEGEVIRYDKEKVDGPYAEVKTLVVTGKGQEIPVDYRMLGDGGGWRIYDVVVEAAGCLAGWGRALRAGGRVPGPASRPEWDAPYPVKEKPKAEEIRHVPTGLNMSLDGAMGMISAARLVCVGETHDNIHAHRVELTVIREVVRRLPGRIGIGREMFRKGQQHALDRWTRGELAELEFLKAARGYDNWGSDFGYYRDILQFAKDNRIDVVALNPSNELHDAASGGGSENR